jgi:hypothetical protein
VKDRREEDKERTETAGNLIGMKRRDEWRTLG